MRLASQMLNASINPTTTTVAGKNQNIQRIGKQRRARAFILQVHRQDQTYPKEHEPNGNFDIPSLNSHAALADRFQVVALSLREEATLVRSQVVFGEFKHNFKETCEVSQTSQI